MVKTNLTPIQFMVPIEIKQKFEKVILEKGYVNMTEELRDHIRQVIEEA
jgi:hypothetical protein